MNEKHLLIAGRPASGKTEVLIAIANMHPLNTLFLSEESSEEVLKEQRNLSKLVKVVDSKSFNLKELRNYETICVDYLELLDDGLIVDLINIIQKNTIRVIATSQVRRGENELLSRFQTLIDRRSRHKDVPIRS